MTDSAQFLWRAKLAAWTHDPAEKALVLLRDPVGHEGGTVRELRAALFPDGVPAALLPHVERADHWASAADRPQFPKSTSDGRYAAWTQVRFDEEPVLIHPLSGESFDLVKLDIDASHIRDDSTDHFKRLIERDAGGRPDAKKTALAFWRFGPEIDAEGSPLLWALLPADTRIPDHTIWTHLDLSSALATAFAGDAEANPALLAVSFGPVQDFIAAARTTSDLWAGSHLLSRIAWAGLRVICERLGPDAVLFPQLRGVPLVDLWLRDEIGLDPERFKNCPWADPRNRTDANPLFAAALPNKFVALVPAGLAGELAQAAGEAMRAFVREIAAGMLAEVLEAAGIADTPDLPCHAQLAAQLEGFPEVHWAAVPFAPLVKERGEGEDAPDAAELARAGAPFGLDGEAGFLGGEAWKRLSRPLEVEGTKFLRPNPGVLYPAIYELLDRLAASGKAARVAPQRPDGGEQGYRCDLTGEAEWLTHDRDHLLIPKGERKNVDTLWNLASDKDPSLSRKGEHLSALAMLKRRWPRWFVRQELEGLGIEAQRFVVSTHTLAIATSLEKWLDRGADFGGVGSALLERAAEAGQAALPRKLALQLWQHGEKTQHLARALPALLEKDAGDDPESQSEVARQVERLLGAKPETYYALILLDGDKMGAWLSGTEAKFQVETLQTFHPQIRARMAERFRDGPIRDYLHAPRAISPARHMAISGALNGFALHLAQEIVENRCKGKLLYAGGDDVLALVAVDDLLACLTLLRAAYAGLPLPGPLADALALDLRGLRLGGGHAELDGRLLRLMGAKATASAGAVIAHHQAPLGAVLRVLRAAEKRAKSKGGRDAFAITLLKRSGGATELTLPWRAKGQEDLDGSPMTVLARLKNVFAADASRKAAYLTQGWLPHLPTGLAPAELQALLAASLGYQLKRQGAGEEGSELAGKLAEVAIRLAGQDNAIHPADTVRDVLAVAEFLAREGRA